MSEIKPIYLVGPPPVEELCLYLTGQQIVQLAESLRFIAEYGAGYGTVRITVERGLVSFMSFEISVKASKNLGRRKGDKAPSSE